MDLLEEQKKRDATVKKDLEAKRSDEEELQEELAGGSLTDANPGIR